MTPLGLERGIKGSRATHTEIKEYYAAVTQPPDTALDMQTIHHQLADRQRALKEKATTERTNKALALENQQLKRRQALAAVEAYTHSESATEWKKKYEDLANKVRDIPLEQVAYELGLEPDPKDKHKWSNQDHIINITGSKFYDWKELKGGGGAIDLVMRVNDCNFKQAVAWLNDRLGESAMLQATSYHAREIAKTEPVQQFTPPVQDESKWERVKTYLTRERRLPSAAVDSLHQRGLIYADSNQNLVSIRRDLSGHTITGASLRGTVGTDNRFKGLARGSKRSDGWFYFERGGQSGDPIQRAVLVESSIDAMSFAVLDRTESRKTLYLSTDGAGQIPLEFLLSLPDKSVIVAYDNDQGSNLMAQRVMAQLPNSVRRLPQAKDWNEELHNTFNLEVTHRQNSTSQQQKPSRNHGRGMSL